MNILRLLFYEGQVQVIYNIQQKQWRASEVLRKIIYSNALLLAVKLLKQSERGKNRIVQCTLIH